MFKIEIAVLGIVALFGYAVMSTFPSLVHPVTLALNGGL